MENRQRQTMAALWMEKAEQSLCSAEDECAKGRLSIAVSRLYYSVFYAVSAAQAKQGKEYGKHSTVRAVFNREYVKTGKVPVEFGKLYNGLFDARNEADYKPLVTFQAKDVRQMLVRSKKFVAFFRSMAAPDS